MVNCSFHFLGQPAESTLYTCPLPPTPVLPLPPWYGSLLSQFSNSSLSLLPSLPLLIASDSTVFLVHSSITITSFLKNLQGSLLYVVFRFRKFTLPYLLHTLAKSSYLLLAVPHPVHPCILAHVILSL